MLQDNYAFLIVCTILWFLISFTFTIPFSIYTSSIDYYESEKCQTLRFFSRINYFVLLSICAFSGLLGLLLGFLCPMINREEIYTIIKWQGKVKNGFNIVLGLLLLCLYVVFELDEPCGSLRGLVLGYLIVGLIIFILRIIFDCCFMCNLAREAEKNQNTQQMIEVFSL